MSLFSSIATWRFRLSKDTQEEHQALESLLSCFFSSTIPKQQHQQHQQFTFAFPSIFQSTNHVYNDTPPTENHETGGMALHPFYVSGTKRSLPPSTFPFVFLCFPFFLQKIKWVFSLAGSLQTRR
jgi:hypothetical protein